MGRKNRYATSKSKNITTIGLKVKITGNPGKVITYTKEEYERLKEPEVKRR